MYPNLLDGSNQLLHYILYISHTYPYIAPHIFWGYSKIKQENHCATFLSSSISNVEHPTCVTGLVQLILIQQLQVPIIAFKFNHITIFLLYSRNDATLLVLTLVFSWANKKSNKP